MPYSRRSKENLETCHPDLQRVFCEVDLLGFECTVIVGHRPEERQNQYFQEGKSRVRRAERLP
jgi:peptidoglycan L-alanyl-D-glutamate endopeptidase CwlK